MATPTTRRPLAQPARDPFVLHACELLSTAGACVAKRMFGGWGIWVDGMNIAIIAYETLYLKTNTDTQAHWIAAFGQPFVFQTKDKAVQLHYFTPPDEALESPALMAPWARLALHAAVAARTPTKATKAPKALAAKKRSPTARLKSAKRP